MLLPKSFKSYMSKPIERRAFEVVNLDVIEKLDNTTSVLLIDDTEIPFKHYQEVKIGDYIVFLKHDDVYHCARDVFHERNIV